MSDSRTELVEGTDRPKDSLTLESLASGILKMHEHFTAEIARLERSLPVRNRGVDEISAEDRALFESMGYRKVQMRMQYGRLTHRLLKPAEEWLVEQEENEQVRKEKPDATPEG